MPDPIRKRSGYGQLWLSWLLYSGYGQLWPLRQESARSGYGQLWPLRQESARSGYGQLWPLRQESARSGYGQLWPVRPESARSEMRNLTSRVSLISVFSKKAWILLCKTDPDRIWMGSGFGRTRLSGLEAWSGFGRTRLSGLEASRCAGISRPGFWQDATGPLPVPLFQTRFRSSTDVPDKTVPNQPGSDLVLADCVRFWPNGSGPEASQWARILRPASGQCFPADRDWTRIGSSMITGEKLSKQIITLAHSLPGN